MSEKSINVWGDSNENFELSNIALRPFTFSGVSFMSVEQYYQFMKYIDMSNWIGVPRKVLLNHVDRILKTKSTDQLFKLGRFVPKHGKFVSDYWKSKSISFLFLSLFHSFHQNPIALKKLIATNPHKITHNQSETHWRESFPFLIMSIRKLFMNFGDSEVELMAEYKRIQKIIDSGKYKIR